MANLIPPMDDEPPPEFIAFVAARLGALRSEAARLTGGDRSVPEVVMQVLIDLAGHWRRLCWRGRLTHRDAAAEYLDRRLTARTRQWREEQIYPVEVNVLRDTTWAAPSAQILETAGAPRVSAYPAAAAHFRRPPKPPEETLAQQLAFFLPSTVRHGSEVVAEAEIAWVHAYRRYVWRRYFRMGGGVVLLIGYLVQFMSQFSAPT
ncbi:hypothetical protein [Actinoplanes sp. ATCC 53533]|uniref:hypothetical protein n=1 Tax=Actinoplanes sp. ATCC 53533 TaxID=1288362 RepID=UPI000F78E6D3|nr:hypothetical protein [Actinoplanes sp. ATCC 53533]